jgi:hypothetical protein
MVFKPFGFRSLPADFSASIRNAPQYTLILVKANGEAHCAVTRAYKDAIVASFTEDDLLLMARTRTAKYRATTDIFNLTKADLEAHFGSRELPE